MRTLLFLIGAVAFGQTIDAGGPGDTFCSGQIWKPGVAGYVNTGAAPWDTTVYGPSFACVIPIQNGIYEVELGLIEPNMTAAGQRVFTVAAGGTPTAPLDLVKLAGTRVPYRLKLLAVVGGGILRLDFKASVRNAVVSSITITPWAGAQGPKGDKGDPGSEIHYVSEAYSIAFKAGEQIFHELTHKPIKDTLFFLLEMNNGTPPYIILENNYLTIDHVDEVDGIVNVTIGPHDITAGTLIRYFYLTKE